MVFWVKEAKKKKIIERIGELAAVRISTQGTSESFNEMISNLQSQLNQIEGTLNTVIKQNWESLKILKRG